MIKKKMKRIWKSASYKLSHLKLRARFFLVLAISTLLSFLLFEALWQNRFYVFDLLLTHTSLPLSPSEDFYSQLLTEALKYNIPTSMEDEKQVKALDPYFDLADPYTGVYIYGIDDGFYRAGRSASFLYSKQNFLILSLYDLLIPDSGVHDLQITTEFNNGEAFVIVYSYHQLLFLLPWVITSLILAILLFSFLLLFFINSKMSIVIRIEQSILRMAGGDLETPVPRLGYDELGALSCELDRLRQTLAETIQQEQESRAANQDLITAMSHDLRTPLTVLNGYLEVLRLNRNPELHAEYLNRCLQKTADLRELTDRMFEYALVYEDRDSAEISEVPAGFLLQCLRENAEYLRLTGFEVQMFASDPLNPQCCILADPAMLKRILGNLFSNIIKYGNKKEPVQVNLTSDGSCMIISLTNTVKKDASKTESNRIGLKSVRKMLTLMDGKFEVNEEETLFCAKFTLNLHHSYNNSKFE